MFRDQFRPASAQLAGAAPSAAVHPALEFYGKLAPQE